MKKIIGDGAIYLLSTTSLVSIIDSFDFNNAIDIVRVLTVLGGAYYLFALKIPEGFQKRRLDKLQEKLWENEVRDIEDENNEITK